MRIQFQIAKRLSKASTISILIALIAILAFVLLVPESKEHSGIAKFIADLFDSDTLRAIAYEGTSKKNQGWSSAIAYALGVILILGILVPVITNRLRTLGERYLNGTLDKYHWKNHALFIGYDELMIGTLKKACVDYNLIVVAVPNGVPQIKEQISRYLPKNSGKIEIVQCNQNNTTDLVKKAGIMKASRIFIIGQPDNPTHDANNLRTLADIAKKWNDKEHVKLKKNPHYKGVPHIMVYLRNQSTFSLLQRQGFSADNLWNTIDAPLKTENEKKVAQEFVDRHCEYFNFYCDKAIQLLSTNPDEGGMCLTWHSAEKNIALSGMENRQVHLVVLGMTPMGSALVRELLRLAHPSGKGTKLLITMVDENAREEMHYFIGRTKELFKLCHYRYFDYDNPDIDNEYKPDDDFLDVEFEFIQCNLAHPRLTENLLVWSADEKQLLTLVVCTNDSSKNMAVALYLPPEMFSGENSVPTWVYQEGDDSAQHLLNREKYPNIHPFSFADHAVSSTANSPIYEWDKAVTQYYEEHYRTKNVAKRWEDKSQDKRWSSLYNVKSIGIKLRAVGVLDITQEIEESKKLLIDFYEHNRWVVERLTMGACPTDAEQHELVEKELEQQLELHPDWKTNEDSRRAIEKNRTIFNELKEGKTIRGVRVHDDIRGFDDLTQYTKDKDRKTLDDYIEAIRKNPKTS